MNSAPILLIDDDPFQSYVLEAALERAVGRVDRAVGAAEALIYLEQEHPQPNLKLLVVALHLPGLTGPSLVNELHSRLPSVPILLLGHGSESAETYLGQDVYFLDRSVSTQELVATAYRLTHLPRPRAA